jgi:hypothetical protein
MAKAGLSKQFKKLVGERRQGAPVPQEAVTLTHGPDSLTVRLAGGYIIKGTLGDAHDKPITVLYSDPDVVSAKINASHAMSPAGASEDIGGQHGIYRWLDYGVVTKRPSKLVLQSQNPPEYPSLTKEFVLTGHSLSYRTTLTNSTAQPIRTSLGHHLYWHNPAEATTTGLQVIPRFGEPPLEQPGVLEAVTSGDARYWSDFGGVATVVIPGGNRFNLQSHAYKVTPGRQTPDLLAPGMLLWQRPGTHSICFEPVIGYKTDPDHAIQVGTEVPNRELELAVGAAVTLQTVISLADLPGRDYNYI